jgi:hypothetical protein
MGRKYIKQIDNQNFVYPNYDLTEYDTDIIHDINENSVSGTVVSLSATTVSYSALTFSLSYTWSKNNAEIFLRESGNVSIYTVHMMAAGQEYFKPWRTIYSTSSASTGSTSFSGTGSIPVVPSDFGLSQFTNGTYYFEVRFIGKRSVYPVCQNIVISTIVPPVTPTPTPVTPTPTPLPPTPTPTPSLYQSGATLNVTDPGWIKFDSQTNGDDYYVFVSSTGTYTITECVLCSSITPGFPFADIANFTITNCGTTCSGLPPTPTPTPSPTPGYCESTEWFINNTSNGYDVYWGGLDCNNSSVGGTIGAYSSGYTGCVKDGTLTYTGFPTVTSVGVC